MTRTRGVAYRNLDSTWHLTATDIHYQPLEWEANEDCLTIRWNRKVGAMSSVSSLRTIKELGIGDHLCCLYETEEEHRALLTPFMRGGLEQGEKVLYIIYYHYRTLK